MSLHRIELIVDDDDYAAINEAIAKRQALDVRSGVPLPDGDGNLVGRYVGELMRDLFEYQALWEAEH